MALLLPPTPPTLLNRAQMVLYTFLSMFVLLTPVSPEEFIIKCRRFVLIVIPFITKKENRKAKPYHGNMLNVFNRLLLKGFHLSQPIKMNRKSNTSVDPQ